MPDRKNQPDTIADRDAYSVDEFCWRHGISKSGFYNLIKAGKAPRQMRVGAHVKVSKEAARDWRRDREADATAETTAA